MNWDCRCYLQLCKEILFSPHSVLLKLWSMIMWIFVEGRLWQLNKSLALWTTVLSAPSKGEKTFFPFFTLSKSVSSIYLCHKKISPLLHSLCHTASVHGKLEAPSWGHQQGHGLGRTTNPSAPPCGTAKSNRSGRNPHPLVQTHLRVPSQCCLIDSDCVRGLGAVYTECQASARWTSVRTGVEERAVSDVGG